MSTMQRVREAIAASHTAIEQTDFAKSLMDGRIKRSAYGIYLNQIWHVHHALERSIADCGEVQSFLQSDMIRTPTIARDAAILDAQISTSQRLPATLAIEMQIELWRVQSPLALLGCLYILEGSRMGSLMIAKPLAKALQLSETNAERSILGIEYHLEKASETPRRVKQFKFEIDAANLSDSQEQELSRGACVFMNMLMKLYEVLPVNLPSTVVVQGKCPFNHELAFAPNKLRSA